METNRLKYIAIGAFIIILGAFIFIYAAGPKYKHEDKFVDREFQNVYSKINNVKVVVSSSSHYCIDNPTFCVDPINDEINISGDVKLSTSNKLYLDGGSNTYISETAPDTVSIYAGAAQTIKLFDTSSASSVAKCQLMSGSDPGAGIGATYRMHGKYSGSSECDFAQVYGYKEVGDSSQNGKLAIYTNNGSGLVPAMYIDSGGMVTQPLQPTFLSRALDNNADTTGDGTLVTVRFSLETFDVGGDFTTSTFTAPITGKYIFSAALSISGLDTAHHSDGIMYIQTSNNQFRAMRDNQIGIGDQYGAWVISVICDMDENDTAYVQMHVIGDSKVAEVHNSDEHTWFSGSLLN